MKKVEILSRKFVEWQKIDLRNIIDRIRHIFGSNADAVRYVWKKDFLLLKHNGSTLELAHVTKKDNAVYECAAIPKAVHVLPQKFIRRNNLAIADVPLPVESINITSGSYEYTEVSWKTNTYVSAQNDPEWFAVAIGQLNASGKFEWMPEKVSTETRLNVLLTKPDALYKVCVTPHNSMGSSKRGCMLHVNAQQRQPKENLTVQKGQPVALKCIDWDFDSAAMNGSAEIDIGIKWDMRTPNKDSKAYLNNSTFYLLKIDEMSAEEAGAYECRIYAGDKWRREYIKDGSVVHTDLRYTKSFELFIDDVPKRIEKINFYVINADRNTSVKITLEIRNNDSNAKSSNIPKMLQNWRFASAGARCFLKLGIRRKYETHAHLRSLLPPTFCACLIPVSFS